MDHFPGHEWWDFAFAIVSPPQRELMQNHLDSGCTNCRELLNRWMQVVEFLRREGGFAPPEDLVRSVKASFAPHQTVSRLEQVADFARLIFDSAFQPQLALVRGSLEGSRHLLHESNAFTVDLHIEPEIGSKRMRITGQILNSREPGLAVANAPVTLLGLQSPPIKSNTNLVGEFVMDYIGPEEWQLFIEPQDHSPVCIRFQN